MPSQFCPNAILVPSQCHSEWLNAWREARGDQIYYVGSHEETCGNSIATLLPEKEGWPPLTLRLRIPPGLQKRFGDYLYLVLKSFRNGQQAVENACAERPRISRGEKEKIAALAKNGLDNSMAGDVAVSWRIFRRKAKRGIFWVAQATFGKPTIEKKPVWPLIGNGALGVDFNSDHIAVCRVDRFGNPTKNGLMDCLPTLPLATSNKRSNQVKAMIGDIVAKIVSTALRLSIPIVIERLDFEETKRRLRECSAKYARMLSGLVYAKFYKMLESRAERDGATIIRVNPRFTSVIGRAKFSIGYNLTSHQAAACAIARRGLRFSEQRLRARSLPSRLPPASSSTDCLPLPARTRGKHPWADWRRVAITQRAQRTARWKARRARKSFVGAAGPKEEKSAILDVGAIILSS